MHWVAALNLRLLRLQKWRALFLLRVLLKNVTPVRLLVAPMGVTLVLICRLLIPTLQVTGT